jgi:hypothetical protein
MGVSKSWAEYGLSLLDLNFAKQDTAVKALCSLG